MKTNIYKTKSLKKYFSALMLLAVSLVFSQKKFTLVLDAGHGDHDHGAVNSYPDLGKVAEKEITLDVTLRVGKMLEKDKNFKVIYTRKTDVFIPLTERTNIANRNKADLFVSIHVNSATNRTAYGTETFVQGPNQNKENLEVAKAENSVIFLDNQDKENFASYDPSSPESLIALKIQQNKYLERSLILGGLVEDNFVNKDQRYSRGVKQHNLHVLRRNAMPSVLIEIGFLSHYEEAHYITSEEGKDAIAKSIFNAIMSYKNRVNKGAKDLNEPEKPSKPAEVPLKNDFRILLFTSPNRYAENAPELKGLNNLLTIKEGNFYKYYYANTNLASVRDGNLKTAKDAGFRNALSIGFTPNQKLTTGYYTLELYVGDKKLSNNSEILAIKNVERTKENGNFYYTYGKFSSLEEALKAKKEIENQGIKNIVIQKVIK